MSIAQALIEQVATEVGKAGHPGRVVRLELIVGRLSGVHADALRFGFEMLSPGTLAEGAELQIAQPDAVVQCQACGAHQPVAELILHCPACGSGQITIAGGQDLLLQTIELEE
jgi:hydrogenase nickel incorporation protein HypA/HybF